MVTVLILALPFALLAVLFVALVTPGTTTLELTDSHLIARFNRGDRFMASFVGRRF